MLIELFQKVITLHSESGVSFYYPEVKGTQTTLQPHIQCRRESLNLSSYVVVRRKLCCQGITCMICMVFIGTREALNSWKMESSKKPFIWL